MPNGIIRDLPAEQYHQIKALSASMAHLLTAECPAIAWWNSPWNPAFIPRQSKPMDLGAAAHLALLEPGRLRERVRVIDAADWRTKRAQEHRDKARAAGLIPLLPEDWETVTWLAGELRSNPWVDDLLDGAETEVSYFWDSGGVPCKARADIITRDHGVIADLKTKHSANPVAIQRAAFDEGWYLRAAWYTDGWEVVGSERAVDYWFIVIDRDLPNPITLCRLDERALSWGRMMVRRAHGLFRRCMQTGEWPGYTRSPITLSLPTWAEFRLADDEASGLLSSDDVRRSMEFLAANGAHDG